MSKTYTINDMIEMFPWMEELKSEMSEVCYSSGCEAKLGERHYCGMSRCSKCGGQSISCGHRNKPDRWSGINMPNLHMVCVLEKLYCHTLVRVKNGIFAGDHPIDTNTREGNSLLFALDRGVSREDLEILWHKQCNKGDYSWYYDLNRAHGYLYCTSKYKPTDGLWL